MKTYNKQWISRLHAGPCRRFRCLTRLAPLLALALASLLSTAIAHETDSAKGILANDEDRHFKPSISFSQSESEEQAVRRISGTPYYDEVESPVRLSAVVVANLAGFDFSKIAADMPVAVSVGRFAFNATLGDDDTRKRDRNGILAAFDPQKKSATFDLETAAYPVKKVGYVKFSWNLKTVTVTVVATDLLGTDFGELPTAGPLDRAAMINVAAFDAAKGGVRAFRNEPVDVTIKFGNSVGARKVFAAGQVRTLKRKVGSVKVGNYDVLSLDSLVAAGSADCANPRVTASVPATDHDADGKISFNGTSADLVESTLTLQPFSVADPIVFVDGVKMESNQYTLNCMDYDATGKCIFTVEELLLPALPAGAKKHKVEIHIDDYSGNDTTITKYVTAPSVSQ
jgi:hypothetical protein